MSYIQVPTFGKKPAIYFEGTSGLSPVSTPATNPKAFDKTFTEGHSELERSFSKDTVFKKVAKTFHRTSPLDSSINSCSITAKCNP
jgi:hypothetical protein